MGLYDFNARFYSAALGRFVSVDPLADHSSQLDKSPYQYGWNNPITLNDPTGECPFGCPGLTNLLAADAAKNPGGTSDKVLRFLDGASGEVDRQVDNAVESIENYAENPEQLVTDGVDAVAGFGQFLFEGTLAPVFDLAGVETETQKNFNEAAGATIEAIKSIPDATPEEAGAVTTQIGGAALYSLITKKPKLSKVKKVTRTEQIGNKFTKKTKVNPGRGPGQSRAEITTVKNKAGKTIRTYKDTFDRANKFMHRKPLRGGPEGRPQN